MDARATYERGREVRLREVSLLEKRSRAIGTARLVLAAAGVALVAGVVWWKLGTSGWAILGVVAGAFLVLVFVHASVHDARERASAALRFHERGIARLTQAWDRLPTTSERFRSADHCFTGDLDIFGKASLMQLVDATVTAFGEEKLAHLLSRTQVGVWPDEVQARQHAVRDLAVRLAFREGLATAGGVLADTKPDATPLIAWADGTSPALPGRGRDLERTSPALPGRGRDLERTSPALPGRGRDLERTSPALLSALRVLAWVLPLLTIAVVTAGPIAEVPSGWVTLFVTLEIAAGIFVGTLLTPMLTAVSTRESSVTRWRTMIAAIEREQFEAPLLRTLSARLTSGQRRASEEIAALERIVSFVDARQNEVFRFLIGPLLFWDVHCAFALMKWRARAGEHLRAWLDTLGEVEALASLGAFGFEHPDFVWPDLASEAMLEASGLAHPLLPPEHRVGNDVSLPNGGRALVITGSNMSGKSTLLRAMGVNAVLAFAGAPACARALRIGPARVATSMRVQDSLEHGVSHFYAELRGLKRVLDLANGQVVAPVLFLLDEILHGTNSRERVIGACSVVRELLERGAFGAVSTHDLGITALERALGTRVQNVHFEEQVSGDEMTFDYVLRPGIVHSSNALRLMRAMGIEVKDEA